MISGANSHAFHARTKKHAVGIRRYHRVSTLFYHFIQELYVLMTEKSDISKKKKLKHVQVYDKLYEQIENGVYPAGSQLPSETALAELMGVSRMTLRKALALFVEDGVIKNVPGIGHFIRTSENSHDDILDMSRINHPICTYCTQKPETTEFEFRIEPPTRSISDSLKQYTPAVVIADRWYKKDGIPFAYSLSFLPIECIASNHINLNHQEELLAFLETGCYEIMSSCKRICSHSTTGNFTATKYNLSQHDSFLLILETITDENGKILLFNKHYIPSELYRIEINL